VNRRLQFARAGGFPCSLPGRARSSGQPRTGSAIRLREIPPEAPGQPERAQKLGGANSRTPAGMDREAA
jgi:hypothetical protein